MKGLILLDYGSPSDLKELRAFLVNMNGRDPKENELKNIMKKYEYVGGSPLREKMNGLRVRLARNLDFSVDYAFLYSEPYLLDVIDSAVKSGINDIVIAPLFNFYSNRTALDMENAVKQHKNMIKIQVLLHASKIECMPGVWGTKLKSDIAKLDNPIIIFSAHSIPLTDGWSREYAKLVNEFASKLSQYVANTSYTIGFQSARTGWIGPSIYDLKIGQCRDVVVVPISFLLTNVEVLYDLDVEYASYLRKEGYIYHRSGPPDDSDELASCLARATASQ